MGGCSPPPSTYRFDHIYFRNITSYRGGGSKVTNRSDNVSDVGHLGLGAASGASKTTPIMNFDCDTHFNGEDNCFVILEHVHHYDSKEGSDMFCHGTVGTMVDVTGTKNCLRPFP